MKGSAEQKTNKQISSERRVSSRTVWWQDMPGGVEFEACDEMVWEVIGERWGG
jgi:hypothetical protein